MSYSRQPADIGGHPELAEMRARLERTASSGGAVAAEGLLMLAGVYAAISPWVVHFSGTEPNLTLNNLIVGIAVAVLALGLAAAPDRLFRLAWAAVPLGIWLIISPWTATATHSADAGMIWNNVVTGAVVCLVGLAAAGMTVGVARKAAR
ncbi:SPW repeat protein [Streptomyces sp. CC228A]|uniref:SPW repeat protein n=1 Tax=Streptomyces sp. CC228A TaxID=2898186 RepID=UPI001F3F3740|nr:SPW repeat protein [Streptomyces sp. CC228A]